MPSVRQDIILNLPSVRQVHDEISTRKVLLLATSNQRSTNLFPQRKRMREPALCFLISNCQDRIDSNVFCYSEIYFRDFRVFLISGEHNIICTFYTKRKLIHATICIVSCSPNTNKIAKNNSVKKCDNCV